MWNGKTKINTKISSGNLFLLEIYSYVLFTTMSGRVVCTIYKMSGRSLSVYKNTRASHEYLCTLIKTDTNFVNYF